MGKRGAPSIHVVTKLDGECDHGLWNELHFINEEVRGQGVGMGQRKGTVKYYSLLHAKGSLTFAAAFVAAIMNPHRAIGGDFPISIANDASFC